MQHYTDFHYAILEFPTQYPKNYFRASKNNYANISVEICYLINDQYVSFRNNCMITERGILKGLPSFVSSDSPANTWITKHNVIGNTFQNYLTKPLLNEIGQTLLIRDKKTTDPKQFMDLVYKKLCELIEINFKDTFEIHNELQNCKLNLSIKENTNVILKNRFKRIFNKTLKMLDSKTNSKFVSELSQDTIDSINQMSTENEKILLMEKLNKDLLKVNQNSQIIQKI